MSRKPAERPEQEQLSLTLPAKRPAEETAPAPALPAETVAAPPAPENAPAPRRTLTK